MKKARQKLARHKNLINIQDPYSRIFPRQEKSVVLIRCIRGNDFEILLDCWKSTRRLCIVSKGYVQLCRHIAKYTNCIQGVRVWRIKIFQCRIWKSILEKIRNEIKWIMVLCIVSRNGKNQTLPKTSDRAALKCSNLNFSITPRWILTASFNVGIKKSKDFCWRRLFLFGNESCYQFGTLYKVSCFRIHISRCRDFSTMWIGQCESSCSRGTRYLLSLNFS